MWTVPTGVHKWMGDAEKTDESNKIISFDDNNRDFDIANNIQYEVWTVLFLIWVILI